MEYLNPQNGRFKKRLKMTDLNPTKAKWFVLWIGMHKKSGMIDQVTNKWGIHGKLKCENNISRFY
jgi:hypothetical protein